MKTYNLSEFFDYNEIEKSGWELKLIGRLFYHNMFKLLRYKLLVLDISDCMLEIEVVSFGGPVIHGTAYESGTSKPRDVFVDLLERISVDTLIVPDYITEDQIKIALKNEGIGRLIVKSNSSNNDNSSERVIFDRPNPKVNKLALLNTKELYGYKNPDGSWLIEPQFDRAGVFKDGIAIVEKDNLFGLVNEDGDLILPPKYDKIFDFRNGLYVIWKNNKAGLINKKSEEIFSPQFDNAKNFTYSKKIRISKEGKYGLTDYDGNIVIDLIYDELEFQCEELNEGTGYGRINDKYYLFKDFTIQDVDFPIEKVILGVNYTLFQTDNKWGIYDKDLNLILEPKIEEYEFSKSNKEPVPVKINGKWGLLDDDGNFFISAEYNKVPIYQFCSDGLYLVERDNKFGIIRKDKKLAPEIVLPIEYDEIIKISDCIWEIKKGEFYGLLGFRTSYGNNKSFLYNVPAIYESIDTRGLKELNKDIWKKEVKIKKDDQWGIIDNIGNIIIEPIYTEVSEFQHDFAIVNKDGKLGIFHKTKGLILKPELDDIKITEFGYVKFSSKGSWGLADASGIIIPLNFEAIGNRIYNNQIKVMKKGKWGLIDTEGNWLLKPKYDEVGFYNEDFVPVKVNGLWGFVNKSGKLIIKSEFTNVGAFKNRYTWVEKNRRIGAINTKGEYIFKLKVMEQYNRDCFKKKIREIAGPLTNSGLKFKEGKWLFSSQKLKIKISPMEIQDFIASEHSIEFQSGGLWGSMDLEGQVFFLPKFLKLSPIGNKLYLFEKNDKYGWCNCKGEILMPNIYDSVDYYLYEDNYLIFDLNGEKKYFLIKENNLTEVDFEDIEDKTKNKLVKYLKNKGMDEEWLEIHGYNQKTEQKKSNDLSPYPASITVLR